MSADTTTVRQSAYSIAVVAIGAGLAVGYVAAVNAPTAKHIALLYVLASLAGIAKTGTA